MTQAPPMVIVAAFADELRPLMRHLRAPRRHEMAGCVRGYLGAVEVLVLCTGEGERNARAAAGTLFDCWSEARLLVVGVAGALSPELRPGELVLADRLWSSAAHLEPDADWRCRANLGGELRRGTVATVQNVLTSAAAKAALWRELDRPQAAVVDMESYHLAATAAERGRPALVVRAVSDTAAEDLPAYLASCRDARGGVDRRRVVAQALLNPATIPSLVRLRRRVALCAERLAQSVLKLVEVEGTSCA